MLRSSLTGGRVISDQRNDLDHLYLELDRSGAFRYSPEAVLDAANTVSAATRASLEFTLAHLGRVIDRVPELPRTVLATAEASGSRAALADADWHAIQEHIAAADAAQRDGRVTAALAAIDAALALAPEQPDLLLRAASIEAGMGRADAARERIRVFQAVDPGVIQGALKLADIEMRAGNLSAAITALEAAHRLNPAWAETKRTLAWIVAADPLHRFGDLDRVARLAEEAVDSTRRRDVIALMTLGAVRARQARFDEAIAAADEALRLNDSVEVVPPGLLYQQRDAYAARRPYSDPRLAGQ